MREWKEVVTALLKELVDAGYTLEGVGDEEDELYGVTSKEEALSIMDELDESFLFIRDAYNKQLWILIINSNGEECITDYTYTPHLGEIVDRVYRNV